MVIDISHERLAKRYDTIDPRGPIIDFSFNEDTLVMNQIQIEFIINGEFRMFVVQPERVRGIDLEVFGEFIRDQIIQNLRESERTVDDIVDGAESVVAEINR